MADDAAPGETALLIIDMINRLAFGGGERMRPKAEAAADAIARLREAATAARVPVIYVNDNHGDWRRDPAEIIAQAQEEGCPGRDIARRLAPRPDDYFVVKPQFSGFYATTLPAVLPRLGVRRLILTGIAADICVLFTAADAHMREYELWVPPDAIASDHDARREWALEIMRHAMDADTRSSGERGLLDWEQA